MRKIHKCFLGLASLFLLSRLVCLAAGRYNYSGPLVPPYYVAPPYLLQYRLLETLFYFHLQPPLYNLIIGLLLKAFPAGAKAAYLIFSHALGLILCLGLFSLLNRLKTPVIPALILTSLFVVSPGAILYEHIVWYSFITCVFLVLAAVFLHRYLAEDRIKDAAIYFFLLAALVLTRTTFHLLWFVGTGAIPFLADKKNRKRLSLALAIPCLLVLGWHAQHIWIFGYPMTSFSLGKQLALMAVHEMPAEVLREIVQSSRGAISEPPSVAVPKPSELPERFRNIPPTGIPALDWTFNYFTESKHLQPNMNHISYLYLGKQWQADAIKIIFKAPEYYARSVAFSVRDYFRPSEDIDRDDLERPPSRGEKICDILYGRLSRWQPVLVKTERLGWVLVDTRKAWFLIIGFPFLFLYGCGLSIRWFNRDKPFVLTVLFMVGTIFWVTMIVFFLTLGESMRYRFKLDPFYIALLGILITNIIATVKLILSKRRPQPQGHGASGSVHEISETD